MSDGREGESYNKRVRKELPGSFIFLSGAKHQIPMTLLGMFLQEISTHINSGLNAHTQTQKKNDTV